MNENNENHTVEMDVDDELRGKGESQDGVEQAPYTMNVVIKGVSPILFHRYDCQAVQSKGESGKGSLEKKTDNVESYLYRCNDNQLGVTSDIIHGTLKLAAKSKADPRSPRKSARDLMQAILLVTPDLIPFLGSKFTWDYLDTRRVVIQRNAVPRTRPALNTGWELEFQITVLQPSYVDQRFLHGLLIDAGRYCGICDHRPLFGRFNVIEYRQLF